MWLLLKAIYGLDDAPLLWRKAIGEFLTSMGWVAATFDKCCYYRRAGSKPGLALRKGRLVGFLTLHIDDEGLGGEEEVKAELRWGLEQRFGPVKLQREIWRHIGHEYRQVWHPNGTTTLYDSQEFYTETITPVEVPKGA